jgi:hypothetical protein
MINDSNKEASDQIDNAIEKIKIHAMSLGFPDPGNLRSSKKKDVR